MSTHTVATEFTHPYCGCEASMRLVPLSIGDKEKRMFCLSEDCDNCPFVSVRNLPGK